MSRLIDADKLINNISCSDDVALGVIEAFIDLQPTAYDVEKVVEELKNARCPRSFECAEYRERAIDIVKQGGIE